MVGKEIKKILQTKHKLVEFDSTLGEDILNEKQIEKKMKGIDCVIHLAGIIDNSNPNLWEVNVKGTTNVLNAAIKAKAKKFVFMSSTAVYGETKGIINEKSKLAPENNYEKSKVEGEKIVLLAKEKIQVNIIRSAMIFGANDYWKKMFKMLIKKYPLPLSGKNFFQIIYSKEIARVIEKVINKGKNGEIYLAAGNERKTLNEFCRMVQEELNLEKRLIHIPSIFGIILGKLVEIKLLTTENIRHLGKERNYNTKKLKSLGWKQKIDLNKAIKEVVKELKM